MNVSGDEAKGYRAVRLDSLENANKGELVSADDETGLVVYKDKTGEEVRLPLPAHSIRILPK